MRDLECARLQYEIQKKRLKMSLVPLPCQECQLAKDTSSTQSESAEWLMDLKDKFNIPIWSRRLSFNTSGFTRAIPMSMLKQYHVEINDRLWSMFGVIRKSKPPACCRCCKPFLGVIVMGLCAARVFRLSTWNRNLLDELQRSGENYFRESFENFNQEDIEFDLKDLNNYCCLQGIEFEVFFKTVVHGKLFSAPLEGETNLAYALLQFFESHQYGILECFNRYLGFGFNRNAPGGYFIFDAQSMNYPVFCKDRSAPYLLRTNHLQILLYCLTIALNVRHINAPFALHSINIMIKDSERQIRKTLSEENVCKCQKPVERILPKEYWDTPLAGSEYSESDILQQIVRGKEVHFLEPRKPSNKLERRLRPRQVPECLDGFKIMPLVEVKPDSEVDIEEEGMEEYTWDNKEKSKDFVRMICSYTEVPFTPAEEAVKVSRSFVGDLSTLLATGCPDVIPDQKHGNGFGKRNLGGKKNCQ